MKKLIILIILILPLITCGQYNNLINETRVDSRLIMSFSPKNPKPQEIITINLTSYLFKLNNSKIEWYQDGHLINSGLGLTSIQVIAKDLSQESEIKTIVRTENNLIISNSIKFRSGEVDLIWEADSYTPLFYKGASLANEGNKIIVEAIPYLYDKNKIKITTNNIYFDWKLNNKRDGAQSGMNKNIFSFETSSFNNIITVSIRDRSGEIRAEKEIVIKNNKTKPIFYLIKPIIGLISEKTLEKISISAEEEITIINEPYFLNNSAIKNNKVIYQWKIDDNIVEEGDMKLLKIIRPLDKNFNFKISLSSTNSENIKQSFTIYTPITLKSFYNEF